MWEKPWIWSLARQVAVALIILLIIFSIIKPALVSLQPQRLAGGAKNPALENDGTGALEQDSATLSLEGREKSSGIVDESHGDILLMARKMARDDPKRVARVLKDWVSEEPKDA